VLVDFRVVTQLNGGKSLRCVSVLVLGWNDHKFNHVGGSENDHVKSSLHSATHRHMIT
jgi:hypothetical protein